MVLYYGVVLYFWLGMVGVIVFVFRVVLVVWCLGLRDFWGGDCFYGVLIWRFFYIVLVVV